VKFKIALILSCVSFASSVSATVATPPSTERAAANLAKAGPIENLDRSHLTVPMGLSAGLPVGLSFIGPKWHDHAVLKAGYAYEQLSKARVTPQLRPTLESK
jgi:Asp-tRNA(Asn)/Glu-tRNA(Gln) amidotransferase A subunit family amidase